jgi:hypothetical protein
LGEPAQPAQRWVVKPIGDDSTQPFEVGPAIGSNKAAGCEDAGHQEDVDLVDGVKDHVGRIGCGEGFCTR